MLKHNPRVAKYGVHKTHAGNLTKTMEPAAGARMAREPRRYEREGDRLRVYLDGQLARNDQDIEVTDVMNASRTRFCAGGPGHTWMWHETYESWICDECAATGAEVTP